jgi:trehalose 6-phosphate synthase/phosphatase
MLLAQHHEHDAVNELYRAADMCVVTSLHDGMNLVCKEFVAARDDERGVLILSRFAGAAREMTEALIVNPYHVEETADALHRAADDAGGRAARAHGQPAHGRARIQRIPLGRAHAGRRRPLALRERIDARVQRHGAS